MKSRKFFRRIIRILYPKKCTLCGEIIPIDRDYCTCFKNVCTTVSDDFCPHCGQSTENCSCGEENSVILRHITAPFVYTGVIRVRLIDFKFRGEKREGSYFAEFMSKRFAEAFPSAKIDAVTYVPMTKDAQRKRGYNQSQILALGVSKQFLIPLADVLVKTRVTDNQHKLNREQRLVNLENAFEVKDTANVKGKTFILCDDIKSTGTTLLKCSNVLLKAGAKDVYCLCAAVSDYTVADLQF